MSRRLGLPAAERWWGEIRAGVATAEHVTAADFDGAWRIGQDFADAGFSIVDRASFAVMQRLKITRVAAFDFHFDIFRYGKDREKAFSVVRE